MEPFLAKIKADNVTVKQNYGYTSRNLLIGFLASLVIAQMYR
jgi:galactitol-specific phosphotransferase system IIC component